MNMDINRTRTDLAELFHLLGFMHIAEIGVEQGEYSETICKNNLKAKVYCIDPWKAYKGYRDHTRQEKLDRFYETAKERLKSYSCEIIRKFSLDAVEDFSDESLDAVYIDANHSYESVLEDIVCWYKKIKFGGIIAGHDYIKRKNQDQYYAVVDAVNDFVKQNDISRLVIYRGESPASWMFMKI